LHGRVYKAARNAKYTMTGIEYPGDLTASA